MRRYILLVGMLLGFCAVHAQQITLLEQGKPTSIRGLSVVDNAIGWASGSKGYVAISVNGGKSWIWQQVKGYEQSDFRDIEAFSAKEAIIMSSGTPALILKTTDGGLTWREVYRQNDKAYFLDAMAFVDSKHGYTMGDPIDDKFLLLETKDSGETWNKFAIQPVALTGEAAFAASGTCLTVNKANEIVLVTGGSAARKITIRKGEVNNQVLPVAQGKPSCGAFSYAAGGGMEVLTGGDYEKNKRTDSVTCIGLLSKKSLEISLSGTQPSGFQSCVIYLSGSSFLSTGTPGSNITIDSGRTWKPINSESYNVCQKAKKGNLILLAGDKGKIGLLKL